MNLNIEWLGKIPDSWQIKKINALYKLRNEKVSDYDYKPLSVSMKGVVPQLESTAKSDDHDNRKLVRKGDFAINSRSDRRNACGISDRDGSVSLINIVLQPRDIMNPNYYNWLFHTDQFADEFYKWGHGIVDDLWTTRWNDMKNILIPYPPLEEQKRIASWLDEKCTSIDAAIDAAEKEIEKFKTYKHAIITNAVTQGIDSSVVTSNKTNTLFGSIRSVYQIKPLKHCCKIVSGATPDSSVPGFWDGDVVWITPADFKTDDYYVTEGERKITLAGYKSCGTKMVPQGSVVFSKRAPIGTVAVTSGELCTNQGCLSCIPFGNYDSKYLYYALRICAETFNVIGRGTTFKEISAFDFSNFKIPAPDYTEQIMISAYLDEKCINIDRALASKQKIVEKLKAYKKSLIYTYVTGKKEVPNG